ncbi:hypothetical protein [Aliikangiella maris]|uniref:DUF3325 domain-containing protein n=2 Tax=Aliikangiella maris TaxID=3162458 RepID=A0ABV2BXY2_9GAMM
MNYFLLTSATLSIIVGLVHSMLGELLIFKHFRKNSIVPTITKPPLRERNLRIIWASWHIASILGWAFGAILFYLSINGEITTPVLIRVIIISMLAAGSLVLFATKARHPGWIGLFGVAICSWLA